MKKNKNESYASALYGALEEKKEAEMKKTIFGFLNLLKKKGELHRIQKVLNEFEKICNKKNGVRKLKIASAFPVDGKTAEKIASALKIEKYELETEEDKSLIGGFVARYEDVLIDASVKNNLNKLRNKLIS